jgi:hypothetical protein
MKETMNMFDEDDTTSQPLQLTPTAIDLAVYGDDSGGEQVVMRVIDVTGVRIDVLMERRHAAAFGGSLFEFAS